MVKHLASLADQRLIISFAPKTLAYTILKRIGELFPGPSKVRRRMPALHACTAAHVQADTELHLALMWPSELCPRIQSPCQLRRERATPTVEAL